ncbi:hypothetical protein LZ575_20385 [Antarcticibacterium sp. 1MA-6-2]|uniref:ABC transporter permease n=1 Tax=Antarcticibacterium sp. 1MA-6-2 TaxID=2908210 RepID=UPI001F215875|nr:FtsX-like permease family protein [Antarcticibacterium sp. 1MA-6-2]UJH91004.1 hypothetical protein LZ575_20385 [Antarcticibacterium sp. 1MA-6-2]
MILSRLKPVAALNKIQTNLGSSTILRKSLLIFQFTVSIAFIIATLVAQKQLHFIQNTNTGVDRSNVIVLDGGSIDLKQFESFKEELSGYSSIQNVTASYDSPVNIQGGYSFSVAGRQDGEGMSITAIPVDKDFVSAMNLEIIKGRNFTTADKKLVSIDRPERQYAFMLNRTAVEALGYIPGEAIGKAASLNGRNGLITAVLEDFNFVSLHQKIELVVIFAEYDWFGQILIKTTGDNINQAITDIATTWNSFNPGKTFEYRFLDDEYRELYQTEQRTASILNIFSLITILISCLGLFGLAAFTATQRKKEVGIRKVLGASVAQLTTLLSLDFLKLVLLGVLIAVPIAWYGSHFWLQGFAYKIKMPFELFVVGGILAIGIALATVSLQTVKAAIANPVKSLRTE